ncbi:unnamed protein product [Paramecium pentaurelia]|uniref:Uncharacterized protein n=1 Tax=Paramecium pentaurelia TaxID=43138 RepID=A0A8S1TH39_9CILI|nr:unnamed protein product [Paramecium pentaurelia]
MKLENFEKEKCKTRKEGQMINEFQKFDYAYVNNWNIKEEVLQRKQEKLH